MGEITLVVEAPLKELSGKEKRSEPNRLAKTATRIGKPLRRGTL